MPLKRFAVVAVGAMALAGGCFDAHRLRPCDPGQPCDCRATAALPRGPGWVGENIAPYEGAAHVEILSRDVWLGIYDATAECYRVCVEDGGCPALEEQAAFEITSGEPGGETLTNRYYRDERFAELPAVPLSYRAAGDYCAWLGGRLATNGEWERAARGVEGRGDPWSPVPEDPAEPPYTVLGEERCNYFHWPRRLGVEPTEGCEHGNYALIPVGELPLGVGPYGHLDLLGLPSQWVADWYGPYPDCEVVDYAGPATGTQRIVRGQTVTGTDRTPLDPEDDLRHSIWPHVRLVTTRCAFDEAPEPLLARGGAR